MAAMRLCSVSLCQKASDNEMEADGRVFSRLVIPSISRIVALLALYRALALGVSLACMIGMAVPAMAATDAGAGGPAQAGSVQAAGVQAVGAQPASSRSSASLPIMGDEQQMLEQQRIFGSARKALELRFHNLGRAKADFSDNLDNHKLVPQEAASRLVGIYEVMRPREAAAVFNVMDPHVLIAIAASMNIRKLSAVMAHMTPDRVNLISQYLVGVRHFRHSVISIPVMVQAAGAVPVAGQTGLSGTEALEQMGDEDMARQGPLLPSRQ